MKLASKRTAIFLGIILIPSIGLYIFLHIPIILPEGEPVSMDIVIRPAFTTNTEPIKASVRDKKRIAKFIEFVKTGHSASRHKCLSPGTIILHYEDRDIEFYFLPGHDDQYYETKYKGRHYKYERGSFINEMSNLGVEKQIIPIR